eukprot:GILJ01000493.1.p1 GENE.GILJ01000493.1~~GILJ01000493.1.p1  ORF type:complete len:217 (+),score=7.86 GILJ01000493.1:110-760(+)
MEESLMTTLCAHCPAWLRTLESCPLRAESDSLGWLMVLFSVIPYLVATLVSICLVMFRTTRFFILAVLLLTQQILNEFILKRLYRMPRPNGACATTFGMPSSHSAFAALTFTWVVLHLINDQTSRKWYSKMLNLLVVVCFYIPQPLSRLYLNYHSIEQVIIGTVEGILLGYVAHVIIRRVLIPNPQHQFWRLCARLNLANTMIEATQHKLESELAR